MLLAESDEKLGRYNEALVAATRAMTVDKHLAKQMTSLKARVEKERAGSRH